MSKWVCLRDNFTFDRYHYEGRTYELPDEKAAKYPKNFRLENATQTVMASPDVTTVVMEPPPAEPTVEKPKKEIFKCSECGKVVSTSKGLYLHNKLARHSPRTKEKVDDSTKESIN